MSWKAKIIAWAIVANLGWALCLFSLIGMQFHVIYSIPSALGLVIFFFCLWRVWRL